MQKEPINFGNGLMGSGNIPATVFAELNRKKVCLLHKQPLRYYCDSCEELICYDCTVMGPHNT